MQMTQLPGYTSRTTVVRRLQKKRMQALLARPEFQVLVESAPDALVMIDEQGRIALVNHQTEVLFGYSRRELLGQELDIRLDATNVWCECMHVDQQLHRACRRPAAS